MQLLGLVTHRLFTDSSNAVIGACPHLQVVVLFACAVFQLLHAILEGQALHAPGTIAPSHCLLVQVMSLRISFVWLGHEV